MPPAAAAEGSLAAELQRAIEERGVSVHWLHRALVSRDAEVDPATLLNWRAGRLLPGPEALPALAALEEVLDLERGRLSALVPQARPAAASLSPGVERALVALGFEGPAGLVERRLAVKLQVDEHGAQCRITRRSAWVSRRAGAQRFPVVTVLPAPVSDRPVLAALSGCEEGPHYTDLAEGVFATALVLPEPLDEGATAESAHQVDLPSVAEDCSFEHVLREPVEEIRLRVAFHPERIPSMVHAYTVAEQGGPERTRTVPVVGTSVEHTLRGFGPGVVGVRWRW